MEMRLDKWLWTVRLFKTRSIATDACKRGRVLIGGVQAKPSRDVRVGDLIQLRRSPVLFSYRILALPKSRLGAKLVAEYLEDITTDDQKELYEIIKRDNHAARMRGEGRPTKKDRRDLDLFTTIPNFIGEEWDFDDEEKEL